MLPAASGLFSIMKSCYFGNQTVPPMGLSCFPGAALILKRENISGVAEFSLGIKPNYAQDSWYFLKSLIGSIAWGVKYKGVFKI